MKVVQLCGLRGPWWCQVCRDTDSLCRRSYGPIRVFFQEAMVMAPPSMCDSAVSPCFHGCLAFLHRHFPPQSPPSHPLNLSLHSQTAALALGLLHNPLIPAPSRCAFQGTCVPVRGGYGCGKDCMILIPFRLPQISCFTLSLKCFSSDSDNFPNVGIILLLQSPTY